MSITTALTLPAGFTDTNTANNSATDTDSVTAAPITADLAVTKSDGVTELLPGRVTTYTIAVTNHGPNAVTGATLTDTAPPGLTFGNWTCVATAGSSCVAGGAGDLSTPVSLLARWHSDVLRTSDRGGRCTGVDREYGDRNCAEWGDRSGAREQQGHGCGRGRAAAKPVR